MRESRESDAKKPSEILKSSKTSRAGSTKFEPNPHVARVTGKYFWPAGADYEKMNRFFQYKKLQPTGRFP